jgi:iron complex outermembrane receptor protein
MRITIIMGASALAFTCAAGSALAQTTGQQTEPDTMTLDEVVVTARRTEENIQNVPVAVTAFSQESLRQRGIESGTDLQNFTPSLSVVGNTNRNQENYTIRGIGGIGSLGTGGGPGVVAYFSEVPSTASGPGLLFDMQSVQVLKGPQGTLFGRNTTGGAVLLDPVKPGFEPEGYVEGTIGNFDRRGGRAAATLPLSDSLSLRLAGQFDQRDGFVTDINTGRDYNNRNNFSLRAGLLFEPNDRVSSYTAVNYVDIDENGPGTVLLAVNPLGPAAPLLNPLLTAQQARGNDRIALSANTKNLSRTLLALNKTTFELSDNITLKNIVSYTRNRGDFALDGDASILVINDLNGAVPGKWNVDSETLTEELQARLDFGGLTFQTGIFYSDTSSGSPLTFVQRTNLGAITLLQDSAHANDRSKAVYGQFSYALTDTVTANAGYRYTWDEFGGDISIYIPELGNACGTNPGFVFPDCSRSFDGKSDGDTWQLGLDWQATPETLIYGVSRHGYKSGGINPSVLLVSATSPLFRVRPETVTDGEIGLKHDWSASGINARTNISAFYMKYEDIQRSDYALIGGFNTQLITNAAEATVKGFEFEGILQPVTPLLLTATYSYNDATYDTYIDGLGVDRSGFPFQYVPQNKYSLDAKLYLPVPPAIGDVSVRASYAWQDDQQVASDLQPFGVIPAYGLLNMRLDWESIAGSDVTLSVYGTNMTDEEYRVTSNATYNTTGLVGAAFGDPRMYGVSLRYAW